MSDLFRWDWVLDNKGDVWLALGEHIWLTFLAVSIGLAISVPTGIFVSRHRRFYGPVTAITGFLYTIPSLALFAFLTPLTGLSTTSAEIGLVGYTLLILVRNVVEGLRGVPGDAVEAATGMGYTPAQRLLRVELPLALPVIVAGIRIATVTTIGLLTVAVLIGVDNLGYLIVTIGINRGSFGLTATFTGIVLAVALAVAADLALLAVQRALTPWARRRGA